MKNRKLAKALILPAVGLMTLTACNGIKIPTYFTIVWKNGDIVLDAAEYKVGTIPEYKGKTPSQNPDSNYVYTFKGWSPAIEKVTKNATYTATFNRHAKAGDDDYDGLPNSVDPEPTNNVFKNVVFDAMFKMNSDLQIDYRWFQDFDNKVYHNELAKLGIFMANDDSKFEVEIPGLDNMYKRMGCDDYIRVDMKAEEFEFNKHDLIGCTLAHHVINRNGTKSDVIFMQVSGTRSTDEWISNFDVGYDSDDYYNKMGIKRDTPDWSSNEDKAWHKGFKCAVNRFLNNYPTNPKGQAIAYVDEHTKNAGEPIIFIYGHSRGAASAEILGEYFENKYTTPDGRKCKTFTYTYASPTVHDLDSLSSVKTETVFNIVNADDLVPMVPLEQWGLSRIGKDQVVRSVRKDLSAQYKAATGLEYENLANIESVILKLVGSRDEMYKVDTNRDANLAYYQELSTESALESHEKYVVDAIQNDLKLPLNYFSFVKEKPAEGSSDPYVFKVYNCKGTILALVSNILSNKYDITSLEDLMKLISSFKFVLNDMYLSAVIDFFYSTGFLDLDKGELRTNTMAKPHDMCSYLVIIDNYQK